MTNLITIDDAYQHLHNNNYIFIDASWHLPTAKRNAYDEYCSAHIEGAYFYDIDAASLPNAPYPHMLHHASDVAHYIAPFGITAHSTVIIYETTPFFAAPRLWWTLYFYGISSIYILDGGLPAWQAKNYPVTHVIPPQHHANSVLPLKKPDAMIMTSHDILNNIDTKQYYVVDARNQQRFAGTAHEPRPNLRAGHIPYSYNIEYTQLSHHGFFKTMNELEQIFTPILGDGRPIITSCGSGITACVLSFGLHLLGISSYLYDGSWSEWGALSHVPVHTIDDI